jgi:hypothetical protein
MNDIDSIIATIWSFLMATAAACVGRLAWHAKQVQKRLRRFWSRHLPLELITAVFMGYVADGLAMYFNLPPHTHPGFVAAVSYLGPPALEKFVDSIFNKIKGD